jgi:hypothetical protein
MADFAGFISPQTLVDQVRSTAPWLFGRGFADVAPAPVAGATLAAQAAGPWGWLAIVRAGEDLVAAAKPTPDQRVDYFALCLASHHASVASYVPTDVDTKIRGHCWADGDGEVLRRQWGIAQAMAGWDERRISARWIDSPSGTVSGHDGEWLGVATGAAGGFLASGDGASAEEAMTAVRAELEREAAEFSAAASALREHRYDEVDLLRLAAILTHNVGDVDQGLSHWSDAASAHAAGAAFRAAVGRLAHENAASFSGVFNLAARLYRRLLSAEGHRHYPLRALKCLRRSPDLLLPIGPFFDGWGMALAGHEQLGEGDRAEIAAALHGGCRKIAGQVGYYRALAGLAAEGGLERFAKYLMGASKHLLKDPEVRRHCQMGRVTWESALRKQCRSLLLPGA